MTFQRREGCSVTGVVSAPSCTVPCKLLILLGGHTVAESVALWRKYLILKAVTL